MKGNAGVALDRGRVPPPPPPPGRSGGEGFLQSALSFKALLDLYLLRFTGPALLKHPISACPDWLLSGYEGYVQTDDYAGYNAACAENSITQLGCWAHARRKFIEAQKANSGKNKKTGKADVAINLIAKLYAIEKQVRSLDDVSRYRVRQDESVPQLNKIRQWLDKSLQGALPKGLLGKALSYMNKNWRKLTVYTDDGRLCIDNNPAENAIRPFVIGRKNWLFSASLQGAKSSANLYSLIETAKANNLEPYSYLRKVFTDLPRAESVEEIEALLPWQVDLQDGVN